MHEVVLAAQAERDLMRLPAAVFRRVVGAVRSLAATPRPPGARKLQGSGRDDYRLRVGDYRVLYEVDDRGRTVRILRVRPRREAYR
ncbi:type II toxin-antitoxin system RelE/ParE family toxin [bacterium]|nr:type II toxin-antitoxin system RelE/ParE family toxin [bacterium]